jgi:hypothetical protein
MATYTLRGRVTDDHRLEVELPEDAPPGVAEVTVTVTVPGRASTEEWLAMLDEWKRKPLSRAPRTREAIDAELQAMRDEWDDA